MGGVRALGDLAPARREHWHLSPKQEGLVLFYREFKTPLLFAMGDVEEALSGAPLEERVRTMLEEGAFFGVRREGRLAAAAGTHLTSVEESVAAVGNVYTHRDWRGRGLARMTAGAVVKELLRRGIRTIALNVKLGNAAAMRVYERLGFAVHCEYCEGVAVRA